MKLDAEHVVRLKSYRCDAGDNRRINVEFYRVSDLAAALIIGGQSSEMLTKTLGPVRVIENGIHKTYAQLLADFGAMQMGDARFRFTDTASSVNSEIMSFEATGSKDKAVSGGEFKTLEPIYRASYFYPAIREIAELSRKVIPGNLKLFYSSRCESEGQPDDCPKYFESTMTFWRGMQAADVAAYPQNLKDYNRRLANLDGVPTQHLTDDPDLNLPIRLMAHIAGSGPWPEDFVILTGIGPNAVACETGWEFQFFPRTVTLDVVTIQNGSARPVVLGDLLGSESSEAALRAQSSFGASHRIALPAGQVTLAPGEKILVPTRIALLPNDELKQAFRYAKHSADVFKRIGSNGFSGKPVQGSPTFKDYEFGPSLSLKGVVIDGNEVAFERTAANFVELTFSTSAQSCPFLLSWNESRRTWTDHGKVLHKAGTKEKEYTEITTLPGLRLRFRLEEREPEVASIDHAEATIALDDGRSLVLAAPDPVLTARDGKYATLLWGQSVEFAFTLPADVEAKSVVETRLALTGYYRRYSAIADEGDMSRSVAAVPRRD